MALATLSPWPSTPAALAAATACLKAAIGPELEDARAQALGSIAAALVERYAPSAPQPVKNESTIRAAGWLCQAPASGARREDVGDISTSFSPAMTGALRASGAMALLSPWKVRRAGTIK